MRYNINEGIPPDLYEPKKIVDQKCDTKLKSNGNFTRCERCRSDVHQTPRRELSDKKTVFNIALYMH